MQQAASFTLDHPQDVLLHSMRGFALQAQVPAVTLVRLARALGYVGWPEVKAAIAQELGLNTTANYGAKAQGLIHSSDRSSKKVGKDAAMQRMLSELLAAQQHDLQVFAQRNAQVLHAAARLLVSAPQVHVAGFRASYPMAYQLTYLYRLFRPSVQLLDGHAGGLEMQLRSLQPRDACVVIGFSPCSKESVQVAEIAKDKKCILIAITDSETSPLSLLAQQTLMFSVQSPSFFPSITAGMSVIEALMECVITASGMPVVQHIQASEQQLRQSGAYVMR